MCTIYSHVPHRPAICRAVEAAPLGENGTETELFARVEKELVESVAPQLETGVGFHKEIVILITHFVIFSWF